MPLGTKWPTHETNPGAALLSIDSIPFKDRGSHLEAVKFEFQSVDSKVKLFPNFQNHFVNKQKIS